MDYKLVNNENFNSPELKLIQTLTIYNSHYKQLKVIVLICGADKPIQSEKRRTTRLNYYFHCTQ